MIAGVSKIDITPQHDVWMEGMIREHKSEGIHDHIFARALVMARDSAPDESCAIVSVEVCCLRDEDLRRIREMAAEKTGIPAHTIMIAATHTHSGPATLGLFNPIEQDYLGLLGEKLVSLLCEAAQNMRPVSIGYSTGHEDTISHYRRLLADDGHVVMNWEPYPPEKIVRPLGTPDTEVGVLKLVDSGNPDDVICILYNHAGHPNVMSGDNYLISGDYAGFSMRIIEEEFNCIALFVNGAQGTMDIDGLKDRDWAGVERTGNALAAAVSKAAQSAKVSADIRLHTGYVHYHLSPRKIKSDELSWAEQILKSTGGAVQAVADGVGDDYKASLFKKLHERSNREIPMEQTCIAVNDCALINFPGELFTEIGMEIKNRSPFAQTHIIGLANGYIGYVPTLKAIGEGGYAVQTRETGDDSEEIVLNQSLKLLEQIHSK